MLTERICTWPVCVLTLEELLFMSTCDPKGQVIVSKRFVSCRARIHSAFHPSRVGKWIATLANRCLGYQGKWQKAWRKVQPTANITEYFIGLTCNLIASKWVNENWSLYTVCCESLLAIGDFVLPFVYGRDHTSINYLKQDIYICIQINTTNYITRTHARHYSIRRHFDYENFMTDKLLVVHFFLCSPLGHLYQYFASMLLRNCLFCIGFSHRSAFLTKNKINILK